MLLKRLSITTLLRFSAALISLINVPLLLIILGKTDYGTWAALTSLIGWISLFDFGVGYALKNTVAKSMARDDYSEARIEVFQTLKVTSFFSIMLLCVFCLSLLFFDTFRDNTLLSLIIFLPLIVLFPLSMSAMILQGALKIHLQSALAIIPPAGLLLLITVCKLFNLDLSIYVLASFYICLFVLNYFFSWSYSKKILGIKNSVFTKVISTKLSLSRLKVGLSFFGLQLSSLVLYGAGTILVYNFLSAEVAAKYSVINKAYMFGISLFHMVIGVFWPEISHLKEKKDYTKIKKLYLVMLMFSLVFVIGAYVFHFFLGDIILFWTKGLVNVDLETGLYFSILVGIQALALPGAVILNANEKIKYQLIISVFSSSLMIPGTILLFNSGYGLVAVPITASLLTLIPMFYTNIHAVKIIFGRNNTLC